MSRNVKASCRIWILVTVALGGCQSMPNPPLVFGQAQTLGVTIAGSPATQGGEFTVGYRDSNFAVVPVTVTQGDGGVTQLNATAGAGFNDALSTLGQFEASTGVGNLAAGVGLGKFFATGLAAKVLADGFRGHLSGESGTGGGTPP